jgi:hypothetical protein
LCERQSSLQTYEEPFPLVRIVQSSGNLKNRINLLQPIIGIFRIDLKQLQQRLFIGMTPRLSAPKPFQHSVFVQAKLSCN